jgi:uncharacterized protein
MSLHPVLAAKLDAAIRARAGQSTSRDFELPAIAGKVHAVIGMRRVGKSTFLQQLAERRRVTERPEQVLYLSFDDDRLDGIGTAQLAELVEEHYRRFPGLRSSQTVHWYFDEIQLVPGWERFVRRLVDHEQVAIVVSGSSAKMLSREVHTSLRGRGIETEVSPFSFREHLRHHREDPRDGPRSARERSELQRAMGRFLDEGGFPESQGLAVPLRVQLLQGYVDTVMFRDVVERHAVGQVAALRQVVRHCLRSPAGAVSVHKLHGVLKSQGHAIGKEALYAFLDHLADAFLISLVPVATDSVRRQHSNPRKVYPVDHALVAAFDPTGRRDLGSTIECIVYRHLRRQRAEIAYVRTAEGFEVDFLARFADGRDQRAQLSVTRRRV